MDNSNSNEQSRLRTISLASTGSAYGEEFFGATRRDRSIDEVIYITIPFVLYGSMHCHA